MFKQRWVIKIGSSLITNEGKGLDITAITKWVEQIALLKQEEGIEIVLVSSGAIIEGMVRLKWDKRPDNIHKLQSAAAVGQMGLVQAYEANFAKYNMHTAQILLTHDDFADNIRIFNVVETFKTLLELNTVPIVNENDTVATDEIRFGDNDTLAAKVASLINANKLIILTDQLGLFNADPRENKKIELIDTIAFDDAKLEKIAGKTGGKFGQGGMFTKIMAAKHVAINNKISTHIVSGKAENVLLKLNNHEHIGTTITC